MYEFHLSLPVPLHNEVKGLLKLQSEKITDFNDQVFWLKIMFAKSDWWSDVMLKVAIFSGDILVLVKFPIQFHIQ